MILPILHLGANKVELALGAVWAHLQHVSRDTSEPLIITVPNELWQETFDPERELPSNQTRAEFVAAQIKELGSFAVQGYIKHLLQHTGERPNYSWVLAAVDDIVEDEHGLVLCCRAIPLDPQRL